MAYAKYARDGDSADGRFEWWPHDRQIPGGKSSAGGRGYDPSIPEIKEWTRFSDYYTDKGAVVNDQYHHVQARAIDPNFLDMMGMKCRGCSAHRVLTDKHQALISESFAKRAFGNTNPIGQVVKCDTLQFKVVGIVDDFGREDLLESTDIFVSMKFKDADLRKLKNQVSLSV